MEMMPRDFSREGISRRRFVQLAGLGALAVSGSFRGAMAHDPETRRRVARNLEIAKRFYGAYHNAPENGRLIGAFDKNDFAEGWTLCSPFFGGETHPSAAQALAEAEARYRRTLKRVADYRASDFEAWPTEWGCAWRWRTLGQGADGKPYEFWEQFFLWSDKQGKVTRLERFEDWHGFPQTISYAWGMSIDELLKIKDYGKAPFSPTPPSNIKPPPAPPAVPAGERERANLKIARSFYEAYHNSPKLGYMPDGAFSPEDFAESWVIYSAWTGESTMKTLGQLAAVAKQEQTAYLKLIPDYKMDNFGAWPTEDGCAWRWMVNGHAKDGRYFEFWEQIFVRVDDAGKIDHFEFFDGPGIAQSIGVLTGLEIDKSYDGKNYSAYLASLMKAR